MGVTLSHPPLSRSKERAHTMVIEKKVKQIKREGSIQEEGGFYKKLKIPTLPPKLPRSGITFHCFKIL